MPVSKPLDCPSLPLTRCTVHDNMTSEKPRDGYTLEAARLFNEGERAAAESGETQTMLSVLTRGACTHFFNLYLPYSKHQGILQLSSGQWDDAARTFDSVVNEKPTNVIALLGKVIVVYTRPSTRAQRPLYRQRLPTLDVNIPRHSNSSRGCCSSIPAAYPIRE